MEVLAGEITTGPATGAHPMTVRRRDLKKYYYYTPSMRGMQDASGETEEDQQKEDIYAADHQVYLYTYLLPILYITYIGTYIVYCSITHTSHTTQHLVLVIIGGTTIEIP